jgi:hypothetical protein
MTLPVVIRSVCGRPSPESVDDMIGIRNILTILVS